MVELTQKSTEFQNLSHFPPKFLKSECALPDSSGWMCLPLALQEAAASLQGQRTPGQPEGHFLPLPVLDRPSTGRRVLCTKWCFPVRSLMWALSSAKTGLKDSWNLFPSEICQSHSYCFFAAATPSMASFWLHGVCFQILPGRSLPTRTWLAYWKNQPSHHASCNLYSLALVPCSGWLSCLTPLDTQLGHAIIVFLPFVIFICSTSRNPIVLVGWGGGSWLG